MKKLFLSHSRLFLVIATLSSFVFVFPSVSKAQEAPCTANWWAYCCRCAECFVVDALPKFGHCRHCNVLCADCRKELGDLDQALEKLKEENRKLLEKMKAFQKSANLHNAGLTDALVRTYGQESGNWTVSDPSSWRNLTLSGFNSSAGKYFTAEAALLSDFEGAGLAAKLTTDVISILQTENVGDAASNSGGTVLDIVTTDGIIAPFEHELISNAAKKMINDLQKAERLKGAAYQQAVTQAAKNFAREAKFANMVSSSIKKADFGSTLYDIYSFIQAGAQLISDLVDIYENYRKRQEDLKERLIAQEAILKNADLMACIKETQDSLAHGGLGFKKLPVNSGFYSGNTIISLLLPEISRTYLHPGLLDKNEPAFDLPDEENFWDVDTFKIKAAIQDLKEQQIILKAMMKSYLEEVIPPLVPWIINRSKELKPATLVTLIKNLKSPLSVLMSNYAKVKNLTASISENLMNIVSGYEGFYLTMGSTNEPISPVMNKWLVTPNEKIKGEFGRLKMRFPADAEWSIDIYTGENQFFTNRSSYSKHALFYDLAPGKYNFKLNGVPIENVAIEKGKEVSLKTGFLYIITRDSWYLYDESKEKAITSNNRTMKLALPIGRYNLNFEGKDYPVTIKDRATLRFERQLSGLLD